MFLDKIDTQIGEDFQHSSQNKSFHYLQRVPKKAVSSKLAMKV